MDRHSRRRTAFGLLCAIALVSLNAPTARAAGAPAVASSRGDVELADAIRAYARFANIPGIFIDESVPKRSVRYEANGLDPATIFDELLRSNGLASIEVNGVLHVATPQVIAERYARNLVRLEFSGGKPSTIIPLLRAATHDGVAFFPNDAAGVLYAAGNEDGIAAARKILNENGPAKSVIVKLKYGGDPLVIIDIVREPGETGGTLRAMPAAHAIAITGSPAFIRAAQARIAAADIRPVRVSYTASVIEITPKDNQTARGIEFGGIKLGQSQQGQGTIGTPGVSQSIFGRSIPIQVQASLDALISKGEARILRRIEIETDSGSVGDNGFTDQIPVVTTDALGSQTVRQVDVGVSLKIAPMVGTDSITSNISLTYSELTGYAANGYPQISTRKSNNRVTTDAGETILISGLYSDTNLSTVSQLPPLSFVPVLGGVFRHRNASDSHNEVVMLITPTLPSAGATSAFSYPNIPKGQLEHGIAPASPQPRSTGTPR